MTLTLTEHKSGAKHLHLTGCEHLRHPLYRKAITGTFKDEYEAVKVYENHNEMGTTIWTCVPESLLIGGRRR